MTSSDSVSGALVKTRTSARASRASLRLAPELREFRTGPPTEGVGEAGS